MASCLASFSMDLLQYLIMSSTLDLRNFGDTGMICWGFRAGVGLFLGLGLFSMLGGVLCFAVRLGIWFLREQD